MKSSIVIILTGVIIGGIILLIGRGVGNLGGSNKPGVQNVSVVDGKQIVEIKAKGGYSPQVSKAKAGLPTVLRFVTRGSFDCSSSVRIPGLGISQILPQTGETDINIGTSTLATLYGTCGMGMYSFQVQFQ